jgi:hypothetical protein
MNEALRQYLEKTSYPLDESTLRCILREDLKCKRISEMITKYDYL